MLNLIYFIRLYKLLYATILINIVYFYFQVPILIPVLLAILSAVIAGVPIVMDPAPEYIAAVLFMVLGVLVYYPLVYKQMRIPCMGNVLYLY